MRLFPLLLMLVAALLLAACGEGDTTVVETVTVTDTSSTDDTDSTDEDEDEDTDSSDGDDGTDRDRDRDRDSTGVSGGGDTDAPAPPPANGAAPAIALEPPVADASGGGVYVTVVDFPPNTVVDILAGPPNSEATKLGTVRTDGQGVGVYALTIPGGSPGRLVILGCVDDCAIKAQATLTLR